MDTMKRLLANPMKLALVTGVLLVALISIGVIVWLLQRPSNEDFSAFQKTSLQNVSDTQEKLAPAVNTYLATFKKHQNDTGSVEQAVSKSRGDLEKFKQAETEARQALDVMAEHRAANDREVGQVVGQLVETMTERTDYLASLVGSYDEVQALFGGRENDICLDILIGETADLTDRKERLLKATPNCFDALKTIQQSGNDTYSDYAKKLEKRLKQLEADAAVTADTEKKYQAFVDKKDQFEKELTALEQKQASDAEYDELRKRIEQVNADIAEGQANFDFSAKRYTRTVKELPTMYGDIFSAEVPTKLDYFQSLADVRLKTLRLVLDDKLL